MNRREFLKGMAMVGAASVAGGLDMVPTLGTPRSAHAASGRNFNEAADSIPLRQVLEGLGVKHIWETDTYQQFQLAEMVKAAVDIEVFSVVIARHPCMLKFTREQRRKHGHQARRVDIDQEKCQRLYECIAKFGCPTFTKKDNGSIVINPDLCIGDGSCLQTCPSEAITKPEAAQPKQR